MIIGTGYFRSIWDAENYYKPYSPGLVPAELSAWIQTKLKEGEIHIGIPPCDCGEIVFFNSKEGRYFQYKTSAPNHRAELEPGINLGGNTMTKKIVKISTEHSKRHTEKTQSIHIEMVGGNPWFADIWIDDVCYTIRKKGRGRTFSISRAK